MLPSPYDPGFLDALAKAIAEAEDLKALEEVRVRCLGRRGVLTEALRSLGALSPEERREKGAYLNELKKTAEARLQARRSELEAQAEARRLQEEAVDVTLPGLEWPVGHRHPVGLVQDRLEAFFVAMGYEVVGGPEVEDDYHNFEALNFPPEHPAREMHDTFFLEDGLLLRTHTSPVQIRVMQEQAPKPLRIVAPGRVYRRDDDPTHSPVFYQIEGLLVGEEASMATLKGTLFALARHLFGEHARARLRPSYFPFTEPSVELDVGCPFCGGEGCRVCKGTGWVEVGGAGMVHPEVLRHGGYDPESVQGFAFGCGIDRMAMLLFGIDDVRLLYSSDVRFLAAF